jgi:tRNA-dihydrouridine synthase B
MKIGSIELNNPLIMAPLAGVTDLPFRRIVKEHGAGLVYTEMVSAQGLLYSNQNTHRILDLNAQEKPVAVQIFGKDPQILAQAARIAVARGADIIDVNMGCPVPKIVKSQEGCYLMQNPVLVGSIVERLTEAVAVPVTVKIRKGWDDQKANAVEIARIAEQAGAAAIAVHGRTRDQFYGGKADWDIISRVKEAVAIPVIGNGDVFEPEDILRMMQQTQCDGVMIGRAAMGNPWIFSRGITYLETGRVPPGPSVTGRIATAILHLHALVNYKGEATGVKEMRKHASWYIRGLRKAAEMRVLINRASTLLEMEELLVAYGEELSSVSRAGWQVKQESS